jgi:hypothetical protein
VAKAWAPYSERKQPETVCLHQGQADIALGLVVVERDAQVGDEAQDLLAVVAGPADQVVGRGLLDPSTPTRGSGATGVVACALGEEGIVAGENGFDQGAGQVASLASHRSAMSRLGQGRSGSVSAMAISSRRWWALQKACWQLYTP